MPFGAVDIAVVIGINLLWGLNIVATKVVVGAMAPFSAGVARLAIILLICTPWMRPPPGRGRALMLFGLVTGGGLMMFMNLALNVATNVGALAIVGQLSVPIALILGALILHERMTQMQLLGVALAFIGVVMLLFDRRIFDELPGLSIMLLSATSWAVSSMIQRQLAGTPVLTLFFWTGLMGMGVMLPLSLVLEPGMLARLPHLGVGPLAWLAFTVFGATLAGQGGIAWLLRRHPLSAVMPLTLGAPVVSVASSHLLLGTEVTGSMILGGIVALGGVVMVTMARQRAVLKGMAA